MKILITGSSGFIGSHLVKALEERGDEVWKISNQQLETVDSLSEALGFDTKSERSDPDCIFHLAAYGNMAGQKDDWAIFRANLVKTMNLLDVTQTMNYKAFVNVSSSSVLLPHQTIYSATKLGAEALCKAFVDEYDKPIVNFRPFSVYGPGEADFRFIPTVFRSCMLGEPMTLDPNPVHDWVYVDDVVNDLLWCAKTIDMIKGGKIHSGTGRGNSNLAVVSLIEEITGKKANITETKNLRSFDSEDWVNDEDNVLYDDYINLREGLQKYYESLT